MLARLTPTTAAIAATVRSPEAYIRRATASLSAVITDGRPPRHPRARAAAKPSLVPRNQFADELGQGGEDVEHQAPAGGGGVDRFVQRPEPDIALAESGDNRDQVLQRAAETIQ